MLTRNRDDNLHTCRKKRTVIFRFHGKGVALRADIFNGHAESRARFFPFPLLFLFLLLFIAIRSPCHDFVKWTLLGYFLLFDRSKLEEMRAHTGEIEEEMSNKLPLPYSFSTIENVINEWGRNESIVRFLPIFRASSSQKILQRILIKSVSTKNKTKRAVDAQRRSMARKITFRRDFQRGSVSSPETDLWILSFPLFSGYSDIDQLFLSSRYYVSREYASREN